MSENWERLDTWPIFEEGIELAVSTDHRLGRAQDDHVSTSQLASEHVLSQSSLEVAEELGRSLRAKGLASQACHEVESEHDVLGLVEINAGIGFLPRTAAQSERVRRLPVKDLDLRRTVAVYAVAGRRRSPAAATMLQLLRSRDWSAHGVSERS
jgi:DNA-binding transcriptional LysR family regulator